MDWLATPDSVDDLPLVEAVAHPVAGGGAQYVTTIATTGQSGDRHVGYRNGLVGEVRGRVELAAAFRLETGSLDCSVGLAVLWLTDSLDDESAVRLDLVGVTGGTEWRLFRGMAQQEPDDAIATLSAGPYGVWRHALLQVQFDRAGNQTVWTAVNDLSVHPAGSPVWVKLFDQVLIGRHEAVLAAHVGFHIRDGQAGSVAALDEVAVRTALSTVT